MMDFAMMDFAMMDFAMMDFAIATIVITTLVYIVACCIKMKVAFPESISSLARAFKSEAVWIIYIWIIAFCLAHELYNHLPDYLVFIGWLCSGALLAVGAMPIVVNCKEIDSQSYKIHCIIGSIACILTQVCTAIISPQWLLVWLSFPLFAVIPYFKGKLTMVAELLCAVSLVGAIVSA